MKILLDAVDAGMSQSEACNRLTKDACSKIRMLEKVASKLAMGELVYGFDDPETIDNLMRIDFAKLDVSFNPTMTGRIMMTLS